MVCHLLCQIQSLVQNKLSPFHKNSINNSELNKHLLINLLQLFKSGNSYKLICMYINISTFFRNGCVSEVDTKVFRAILCL